MPRTIATMSGAPALFVHIPKTAGSSIERALGIHGTDNRGSNELDTDLLFGRLSKGRYLQHYTASELIDEGYLSADDLGDLFVFTVVRNPYDRLVSEFSYRRTLGHVGPDVTFDEFAEQATDRVDSQHLRPQAGYVVDQHDNRVVDRVARFETLEADLADIARTNGWPDLVVPHTKRTLRRPYADVYSSVSRRVVESMYAQDLQMFGYDFEKAGIAERLRYGTRRARTAAARHLR